MTQNQGLLFTAAAALLSAAVIAASSLSATGAAPTPPPAQRPEVAKVAIPTTPLTAQPKALTDNVQTGIKWLIEHQSPDGGWSQGEESAAMGQGMEALKDKSNVGDTCIAVLALLRTGSTPTKGEYASNIRKGIDFVIAEVNKAPAEGLTVTSVNGTRIQTKLGPNIDTFLSSLMLGEIRNQMPDAESKKVLIAALDKVMDKIEKNQQADGRVAQGGWAPGLAQGIAAKGANVVVMNGGKVSEDTLRNFENYSGQKQNQIAAATPATAIPPVAGRPGDTGTAVATATPVPTATVAISGAGGVTVGGRMAIGGVTGEDAGVPLYAQASNISALQNAQDRLDSKSKEIQRQLQAPTTAPAEADKLRSELKDIDARRANNGDNLKAATDAVNRQVADPRFIAGFGSNGGEEFLSYLNLGESLIKNRTTGEESAKTWTAWDTKMTTNLNTIQNKDGSWSGQHCITGRTFCTSAALMVLMLDRETTQLAEQIKRR